ncbi:hypothetical protein HII13_004106 [Brettanomyces bruxellensis]|nr:hypothetical protein HII13_004106 [Brettanomyces bruxellensis]
MSEKTKIDSPLPSLPKKLESEDSNESALKSNGISTESNISSINEGRTVENASTMSNISKIGNVQSRRTSSVASSRHSSSRSRSIVSRSSTGRQTARKSEIIEDEEEIFGGQVNACCLDFLLNELVPLSMRVGSQIHKNENNINEMMKNLELTGRDSQEALDLLKQDKVFSPGRTDYLADDKAMTDASVLNRIEQIGFEVGYKISDCIVYWKQMSEKMEIKLTDTLEIMKFICRDVWKVIYRKQMDNLRTNHIGTFILIDNGFRPLLHFQTSGGDKDTAKKAEPFLRFPCGLIRGILKSLGIDSVVKATVNEDKVPSISFSVQTNLEEKE